MRLFSDKENELIKFIVDTKEKGINSIQYLQAAKILRERIDFFALKWTIGDKPSISVYYSHSDDENRNKEYNAIYFDVCDFIYFIKELESYGFIAIQSISSSKERDYNLLFDRDKYFYNETEDKFIPNTKTLIDTTDFIKGDPLPLEEVAPGVYTLLQVDQHNINLDFANDLQKYGLGIIYPLPLAVDYVNNRFQTLEQLQYKHQMQTALNAAKWSRIAALFGGISTGIAFASLAITTCTSNKPTTIDRLDLERIETAIKANHISEPFEIITNDTLVVKPILPAQNKKK